MRYFILIKNKKAKQWSRAIPLPKDTSKSQAQKIAQDRYSSKFNTRIITSTELRKRFMRM